MTSGDLRSMTKWRTPEPTKPGDCEPRCVVLGDYTITVNGQKPDLQYLAYHRDEIIRKPKTTFADAREVCAQHFEGVTA